MSDSDTALEHLKLIRGLMEKASVYRTVTVPTALVGGLAAVIAAAALFVLNESLSTAATITVWLGIFVGINVFHHGLIWRTARLENEPYLSSGLHMALKAILVSGRVLRRPKAEVDATFEEIRSRLKEELDYLQEAANIATFHEQWKDVPWVTIPRVHGKYCTERVLTMDRINGVHVHELRRSPS